MPQYIDGLQDNFNVEVVFSAIERKNAAHEALKIGITDKKLSDLVYWESVVNDRALWLRNRALTHAIEFLSE